jgi:SNF2 family DNA or RNA helicase
MNHQERRLKLNRYLEGVFTNTITEAIDPMEQPSYIKKPLYLHQRALVKACYELEQSKFNGIDCGNNRTLYSSYGVIADRVGSGKSLAALTLLRFPFPDERQLSTLQSNSSMAMVKQTVNEPTKRRVKAALFIIPHSLMGQWVDYVQSDTDLTVIFCRRRAEATDKSILNFLDSADAVIVSSTMWKDFDMSCNASSIYWSRIFIDEADTIIAPISHLLTGGFTWLITASYLNIAFPSGMYLQLNVPNSQAPMDPALIEQIRKVSGNEFRVDGTSSNSHYIRGLLGETDVYRAADMEFWRIIKRNSDEFVEKSFQMPALKHHQIICRATANIRILESVIPNEVMDMLHAGDTRGALQALGVTDESPTMMMESLTRALKKEKEQHQKKLEFYKTLEYSSEAAKTRSLETIEAKITSLESRIETIETRMTNINSQNCPICYGEVETPTLTPCCKNLFCFACLCESLKRQSVCPLCRADIKSLSEIHVLNKAGNTIVENAPAQPKTKIEEFISFLEQNPKSRVLMFSSYDASFFQMTSEMNIRNIKFSTINGSTQRVAKVINEFTEGIYQVLLLNSRHVGSGLNILSATDVFLFHKMNSEMEKQIVGRAYRMGRRTPLNVHHLLHQNELSQN